MSVLRPWPGYSGPDGKLIPNPYQTWKEVEPILPATSIEVLGPAPDLRYSRRVRELAMGGGARRQIPALKALRDPSADQGEIHAAMAALGLPAGVYDAPAEKNGKAPKGEELFDTIAYAVREDGAYRGGRER